MDLKKYLPTVEQAIHSFVAFVGGALVDFFIEWATNENITGCLANPTACVVQLKKNMLLCAVVATVAYIKSFPRKQWTKPGDTPVPDSAAKKLPLILLALCLFAPTAQAQTGATPDDLDAVFSAWGQHQAGLTITFSNGSRLPRWLCWFCTPYMETPADYRVWNFGRVKSWPDPPDGSASMRFVDQPPDCNVVNFRRSDNHILVGCFGAGGGVFEPAVPPGTWRALLAGQTPDARAKVIP